MLTLKAETLRQHLHYWRWYSPQHARAYFPARFIHQPQHPKNRYKDPAQCTMFICE